MFLVLCSKLIFVFYCFVNLFMERTKYICEKHGSLEKNCMPPLVWIWRTLPFKKCPLDCSSPNFVIKYFNDCSIQVFTDYVHVKLMKKVIFIALKIITAATIVALLYFNQHDIGVTQAVKDVWNIKQVKSEELGNYSSLWL